VERKNFRLFRKGVIAGLRLPNRLVRSATWDPAILHRRKMVPEVLELYGKLAEGGVGLIITGDFSVIPRGMFDGRLPFDSYTYSDVRISGFSDLVDAVRSRSSSCRIIAQISGDAGPVGPSDASDPFHPTPIRALTKAEIEAMVERFSESIEGVRDDGFDGVQLHAAHGGLLSRFLSPYSNRRTDHYGGSTYNRVMIISRIVSRARERVGPFPILIKLNCTDYLEGGIEADGFPELARAVVAAGVDAVEVSGGMRDCLIRGESELGFKPVPSPESHTRIRNPKKQSYFREFVKGIDLPIPLILCGGNRNVHRVEEILEDGHADFISMCRPLLCEPGLPRRWLEGQGPAEAACIACNSCIYHMRSQLLKGSPEVATCLFNEDRAKVKVAQRWLNSWVREHRCWGPETPATPTKTDPARRDGEGRRRV